MIITTILANGYVKLKSDTGMIRRKKDRKVFSEAIVQAGFEDTFEEYQPEEQE